MLLNILKLIRAKNLLIIAFTQYLMRYAVIFPMLESKGFESQFSDFNFFLLVLTTVILAAAGYVINDYFDTKTDLLNRPKTVVVGKHIKRRSAMTLHIVLNIVGIVLGFYISLQINLWKLVYIYVLITGLLWFYSSSYKKMFLIGNIIVAILTALVPLMTVLYEIPPLNAKYTEVLLRIGENFYDVFFWIMGFSVFAFITTLNREIIKDAEDFEGDNAYGSRSLPVVAGLKTTKAVTISVSFIIIILIIFSYFKYVFIPEVIDYISMIYIFILLIIPNLYLVYKIYKAKEKNDWKSAGNLSKLIMLFGVLYALVVWYNFYY
ncbi:MAG: geranylgeranylglycerol-phosphate geranylgeranyltransferase [Bacteroidales bacterium]|nr:geranylgeranylglycerol-phosphate geranylgeranyltransferase [Bacteroidales bacterium]